jgi:flavin reductase (DIM6/NTAB) family NADH-FMN oxidoreductase RutF
VLGVSVLSEGQATIARQLASRTPDRFHDVAWNAGPTGAVRIDGASAWLECGVEQQVRAGDHDIVVLSVLDLDVDLESTPLVFHGSAFRRLHPDER